MVAGLRLQVGWKGKTERGEMGQRRSKGPREVRVLFRKSFLFSFSKLFWPFDLILLK
jgi:hypothetical protein